MRTNRIFWPLVLIILGGLFLLSNMGIITFSIWGIFFPLLLILGGVSVLLSSLRRARQGEATSLSIPLEGGENARLRIKYGAGRMHLSGGAASGDLLSGTFDGGLDHNAWRGGGRLDVTLSSPSDFPWDWNGGRREWDVRLNERVPLVLDIDVGAAESRIDLTDVCVTDLKLDTGASSSEVWMPARAGQTTAKLSGGAASIKVTIPPEVAARIRWDGGLATINVDTRRFPQSGKTYQSPNYETAANKIDLKVDMGMGSVEVH
jgi:hypothetical protein